MGRKIINIGLYLLLLLVFSSYAAAQGSRIKRFTVIRIMDKKIFADENQNRSLWHIIAVSDSIVNSRIAIYRSAKLLSEIRMTYNERYRYAEVNAFTADKDLMALSFRQARGNSSVHVIHPFFEMPKMEFAFSNVLSWTTYFQYDGFLKNYNVNSRLQWRIKPLSDMYLAYSDNYFAHGTQHNDRSLELKIGYWIK